MELNEYQKRAMSTCMPTSNNLSYMGMNLIGEVGEFFSKIAKGIRKGKWNINDNNLEMAPDCYLKIDDENELKKECGDIMWQLFGVISAMGWDAEEIAQMNLDKLQARKQNGTIDGSGDGVTKEERS